MTWTSELVVGDRIALTTRRGRCIIKVVRLTKTQIITNDGMKWNRVHGRLIGRTSDWDTRFISPLTDDVREEVRRRILIGKIESVRLSELTTDQLTAMAEIVKDSELQTLD